MKLIWKQPKGEHGRFEFSNGIEVYRGSVCFPERPSNIEKGAIVDEEERWIVYAPLGEEHAWWAHYDLNEHGRRRALAAACRAEEGDFRGGSYEDL